MKIVDRLRKFEKLVYINRVWIHRNDAGFRKMVLEGYENPDYLKLQSNGNEYMGKTVYVISEHGNGTGFFAEVGVALIHLYFADERGLTPCIHWGEKYLYYEKDGIDGENNAFYYYFSPVSEVVEATRAAHVVMSDYSHYKQVKDKFSAVSYEVSEEYINAMAAMMGKYFRYNQKTRSYLEAECGKLIGQKKTIGVHYRGTDFKKQYNNHPMVVRVEQEIEKVRELLENGGYEQIFLATDEMQAIRKFKEAFGERVKIYPDTFREEDENGEDSIAFSKSGRKNHHYRLGLEVIRDEYTLVQCDALVCGYSNVTFIARIMKRAWYDHDYEHYVLIDNGINHNENYFWKSKNAMSRK